MFNDIGASYNFNNPNTVPVSSGAQLGKARIKVIGVGGAGNNAVNRMIEAGITSAEYYVVNTDSQILALSLCKNKIQIGAALTKGLGAGADPEIGRAAAEESKESLAEAVKDTDLLFITAGMGGGTGTGAAPVIAKLARDMKILTVAVVTEPFTFEGRTRMANTAKGLDNLKKYVDTLIIIPNDKIRTVVAKNTPMVEALRIADEILKQGIRGIAELIVNPALINLDFADVKTILKDKGIAHLGVGVAKGDNRVVEAVRLAISCPLLQTTIEGAKGVILNICGGQDLTFDEVTDAAELVKGVVAADANIIFGARIDPNVHDEVEITVIATGFPGYEVNKAEEQRVYRGGNAYESDKLNNPAMPNGVQGGQQGYNTPLGGKLSVSDPYYPNRSVTYVQIPAQQNPQVVPQYNQQPVQQGIPVQQGVPMQQVPVQQGVPVQQVPMQQGIPVQQGVPMQQVPVQPGIPVQQAPVQQGQPVQPNGQQAQPRQNESVERPVGKEIPRFIQALKGFGKKDN